MMVPLRLGLVGLGKIALSQHLPAIANDPDLVLAAAATLSGAIEGVPIYQSVEDMLAHHPQIDAVVMCQPPLARFSASRTALLAGKHVFLEKPPGASIGEVRELERIAHARGLTLFAGWHSRWSEPVAQLKRWCAGRVIDRVGIEWKEDVRLWHPGQDWIWDNSGFGVFDPGINALSILTEVLPTQVWLNSAVIETPANCASPVAAQLFLQTSAGFQVDAVFDWRQTGPQIWKIEFTAGKEAYTFAQGNEDELPAVAGDSVLSGEYPRMYRHFVELVRSGRIDVDIAPLEIIADACLRGEHRLVDAIDR